MERGRQGETKRRDTQTEIWRKGRDKKTESRQEKDRKGAQRGREGGSYKVAETDRKETKTQRHRDIGGKTGVNNTQRQK